MSGFVLSPFLLSAFAAGAEAPVDWRILAPPEVGETWVRPTATNHAQATWGHAKGMRVGIAPFPGWPRGLLRVYTPYLGHSDDRMVNFIAVEPTVAGARWRSYSELEASKLDSTAGKRFWSADDMDDSTPRSPESPARGVVRGTGTSQTLTVFIYVEPFDSGACVCVRLRFRADRPHEVGLATFAAPGSKRLTNCILTATMGNYARLRRLHLRNGIQTASALWPRHNDDTFTPHASFPLSDLIRTRDGSALFVASPNEPDPVSAIYEPSVESGWRYAGRVATQYWRCESPAPGIVGLVNGRVSYYGSSPRRRMLIPGGVAFENFELVDPFREGAEYWFGITPLTPERVAAGVE